MRKDGTAFPCEIQGRKINYQGRSIRITALRDITERRRAEKELLKSEVRYRTLVAAILHDQEGKHVLSIVIHRDVTALKQAETALRKAHDELEVRVEKRTVELAKANEELCGKIAESKQAEEEKLTEVLRDERTSPNGKGTMA